MCIASLSRRRASRLAIRLGRTTPEADVEPAFADQSQVLYGDPHLRRDQGPDRQQRGRARAHASTCSTENLRSLRGLAVTARVDIIGRVGNQSSGRPIGRALYGLLKAGEAIRAEPHQEHALQPNAQRGGPPAGRPDSERMNIRQRGTVQPPPKWLQSSTVGNNLARSSTS